MSPLNGYQQSKSSRNYPRKRREPTPRPPTLRGMNAKERTTYVTSKIAHGVEWHPTQHAFMLMVAVLRFG